MPIKQLESSDRFCQDLFRSGRAFKSLQSSSIKMTMWCPFISSPWMVYPFWHSTVNGDLGKAVLADVASKLFVPQYEGLCALCSPPTWHVPFVYFGWKNYNSKLIFSSLWDFCLFLINCVVVGIVFIRFWYHEFICCRDICMKFKIKR